MNGQIHIQSKTGKGTQFTIELCFKNCSKQEELCIFKKQIPDLSNISALVVDDNLINLKLAKALLEKKGIKIQTSENAETALL